MRRNTAEKIRSVYILCVNIVDLLMSPSEHGVDGLLAGGVVDGDTLQHILTPGNILVTTLWTESDSFCQQLEGFISVSTGDLNN